MPLPSGFGTATLMLRIPPSSSMAASGSPSGLPWAPFMLATAATPWPFSVRATITVGRPVVAIASAMAASISATSWPSIGMACQPKPVARLT